MNGIQDLVAIQDFVTILRRLPADTEMVCLANEAGETYAILDSARGEHAKRLADAINGGQPEADLFTCSSTAYTVPAETVLRMFEEPEDFDGPNWYNAKWVSLGSLGGAVSFCGVPRSVRHAWSRLAA